MFGILTIFQSKSIATLTPTWS